MSSLPSEVDRQPSGGGAALAGLSVGLSGGAGHLGAALAVGLAAAGAEVFAFGRTRSTLELLETSGRGLPGRINVEVADVRADGEIERVLDTIIGGTGRLDGWVNNAYSEGSGDRSVRARTQRIVSSALVDVIAVTELVADRMAGLTGGSIVNISSMYGIVSSQPAAYGDAPDQRSPAAYGAAKAGVIQFTRYAACHRAAEGVRINAVAPGAFPAPAVAANRRFAGELERRIPMGRLGRPEELVGPVTFLLGDASSYVTGHTLVVDGGWTSW